MKKILISLLLFGAFLFFVDHFSIHFSNKTIPERFIGPDVLAFSRQYDLIDRLQDLQKTPLADTVKKIDYQLVASVLDIPLDIDGINSWKKQLKALIEHPVAVEILGDDFTLALFEYNTQLKDGYKTNFKENLVIIARPKHHARIVEILSGVIDSGDHITDIRYGGHTIKRVVLEDNQIVAFVRVKNLLLMSYNERLLRNCLDVYDNNKSILTEIKEYQPLMNHFKKSASINYINIQKSSKLMIDLADHAGLTQLKDDIKQRAVKFTGYKSLFWGSWDSEATYDQKTIISFNEKEILPEYRELFKIEPGRSSIYKRISSETIWYYWTNILRPKALVALYNHGLQGSDIGGFNKFVQEATELTGMTSEELLSLIENNFLIVMKNMPEQQFVPIPRVLMALKINNHEQVGEILGKIIQKYEIPLVKQSTNGIDFYLWGGVDSGNDLQPSFSVVDDYLVLASNRQQMREFILPGKGYETLDWSESFRQVSFGEVDKVNSLNYIDFSSLTEFFKEVVSWVGTMIAIQDRETAQRSKILIDELINPLLDGLSMYSTIGMKSYNDDETIIIDTKVLKTVNLH